jgi:transcriptional regulator GlxA family with amidase domain
LLELESHIKNLSLHSEIKASALAYELILLSQIPHQQKEIHPSLLIQNCLEFLNQNFASPLTTIGQAAKKLNVSRNHLSRQFHAEQGMPPTEYLTHLRIQKGIQLLKSTPLKIHEIASACGFEDPNYFARVIRKRIKDSPTLFRNS